MNIFEIKRNKRQKIEELKLKLNEKEYIIYKIELYIDIKERELRRILNYKYNFEYDKEKMKMELNMSEWIYLGDNDIFVDEIYEEEEKENEKE